MQLLQDATVCLFVRELGTVRPININEIREILRLRLHKLALVLAAVLHLGCYMYL